MGWIQTRDANWQVPYTGGWCLKWVQDAFGTDHPYPSASAAWNANYGNGNHPGELPPKGKTVAVYFALGNVPEGHVAISLDDGYVASSTQPGWHPQGYLHPNLQNMIDVYGKYNGGCTYLGWSEYVGSVKTLVYEAVRDEVAVTPIIHDTIKEKDPDLEIGQEVVAQQGKDGQRTVVTRIISRDNREISRTVVSDETVPPVATIIKQSSRQPAPPVPPLPPSPVKPTHPVAAFLTFIQDIIKLILGARK